MLQKLRHFLNTKKDSKMLFWKLIILLKNKIYKHYSFLTNPDLCILGFIRHYLRKIRKRISQEPPKKYYLSAIAIFKQEDSWLCEWIEYHRLIWVEHFYLYNNDTNTTTSDAILAKYVQAGVVENIHFPVQGGQQQILAYKHGIENAKWETEWLCIIDIDEFIYIKKADTLPSLLKDYEAYSGLVVNWQVFGSSWLKKTPPNQLNYFLYRAKKITLWIAI